jgi:LSD1 subclass zinc finger protein
MQDSTLRTLPHKAYTVYSKIFQIREFLHYLRDFKVVRCADEYCQNVAFSEAQ